MKRWAPIQALTVQHGLGDRAKKNPNTGESVVGAETLPDEDLAKNRTDLHLDLLAHPLCDDWHKERSADLSKVTVPLLSCANWGGRGIHPRGDFNGFMQAGELSEFARTSHYGTRGTGGMTHADPISRPRDVFGGTVTLHAGGAHEAYLLVPIIPSPRS